MTDDRERLGPCEACDAQIYDGDPHHHTADGCWLCEKHSPMLSDVVAQYEQILSESPFDSGEIMMDEDELREVTDAMILDIKTNGDRKVFHQS